ncbi:unnamed protein product [Aphis gossypii]|uniref:Uncharacterized protein n=1 Tax=Aphis gossypii TaxID=80765 RepID=A0A9P0JB04_APHGO|nr:unnamed protein product [Aphis gossypii]
MKGIITLLLPVDDARTVSIY